MNTNSNGFIGRIGGPKACEVKPNSKPWIVRLIPDRKLMEISGCGGTLVSRRMVLTAAHCVWNFVNGTISSVAGVVVGDHSKFKIDKGEKFIETSRILLHENFHEGNSRGIPKILVINIEGKSRNIIEQFLW